MGSLDLRFARPGLLVTRPAAALPQSGAAPLFTISGGMVLLIDIVGVVTTVIQTQTNNTKLISNPTVGTDVDICAALNISADAVGDVYTITGTFSDALVGAGAAAAAQAKPVILPAGTLDLSCSASNTGAIRWVLHYLPLEDGATVRAA